MRPPMLQDSCTFFFSEPPKNERSGPGVHFHLPIGSWLWSHTQMTLSRPKIRQAPETAPADVLMHMVGRVKLAWTKQQQKCHGLMSLMNLWVLFCLYLVNPT